MSGPTRPAGPAGPPGPAGPSPALRVLLLADTHLGFDFPLRPRVQRRRRGPDFFANTRAALAPARRGEVDLVVHGGDVLYRSKVPPALVQLAFEPLLEVADAGVPVVVVPGNHERSAIPYPLLVAHERLHLLDRPRTLRMTLTDADLQVHVSGFPCERDHIRRRFGELLAATGWQDPAPTAADVRLLCMHQTIEGARVGTGAGARAGTKTYTFRQGPDILPGRALPAGFAAVLAGHIHRHQHLTTDLAGRPLRAPVLYPGAIERTSAAERQEDKGYLRLTFRPDPATGGELTRATFVPLPARPLIDLELDVTDLDARALHRALTAALARLDPDAVVRLRPRGTPLPEAAPLLSAPRLRALAPDTMTLTVETLIRREPPGQQAEPPPLPGGPSRS